MVRTGPWLIRVGLIAVLALLCLIATGRSAVAAKYSVVQCGWGVGKDADWTENAAARYNHSALCVPSGSDIWKGVEIRTYTRPASGSAAAATTGRWVWKAPADTVITNVRGTWWHELRNHFQHRLGGMAANGNFQLSHSSSASRGMQAFAAGFGSGVLTFESRLVCARLSPNRCDTSPSSAAMVRALTITLSDNHAPQVNVGGSVYAGGWLQGGVNAVYAASDRGGGMRIGETLVDGARVGHTEHHCELVHVGGELHGRRMLPCYLYVGGSHAINTAALSDGPHSVQTCVTDFAGNRGCSAARQFQVDNNPPAPPAGLQIVGGGQWRNRPGFEVIWQNPDQGRGSPIAGAYYRVTGPGGFDSGERHQPGDRLSSLSGPKLAVAGEYRVSVRLHDQAGRSASANAASTTVRFDDIPPEVGFRGFSDVGVPERIRARIVDRHSGPAGGTIAYRRQGDGAWKELPAKLEPTGRPGEADLVATFPSDSLEPDVYEFRVVGQDRAGNGAESMQLLDGRPMLAQGPLKAATRVEARLEVGGRAGTYLEAGFAADPVVSGRLTESGGAPLPGRELRLLITPEAGARLSPRRHFVVTGEGGEFRFQLGRSTSRRIEVRFPGDDRLAASRAPDLGLRVGAAVSMRPSRRRLTTGQDVFFLGQVDTRDARLPNEGKLVTIQYRDRRAKRWRPVLFVRSDSQGAFRARYRFRSITRPSKVRLRAVALPEAQWPYAPGVSAPIDLRVLPKNWRKLIAKRRAAKRRRVAMRRQLAKKRRAAKKRLAGRRNAGRPQIKRERPNSKGGGA